MTDRESRRTGRAILVFCLYCAVAACGGGAVDTPVNDTAPTPAPLASASPAPAPLASVVPVPAPLASVAPESAPLASARPVQAAVPAPVTTNPAVSASCQLSGSSAFESELLLRVNALRAAGAVCGTTIYTAAPPLNWNNLLQQAASGHSGDMAKNNYFSHDSLNGINFAQRLSAAGYGYGAAGENIAAGDSSVEQVVNHWLHSPGHCVNMMNPSYREIGVACASSHNASYGSYWTMDLGGF